MASSTSRSRTRARTSSASSPARSSACANGSLASSTRAASSSRTPRTSSERHSFRSAATSSCSWTRTSTRRRSVSSSAAMREQVDRLTKLAGELLDLSRLDAGRLRVDRDPVDLSHVARAPRRGVRGARPGKRAPSGARASRQRDGPRRRAAGAAGRPGAGRECAPPHACGHSRAPRRRAGRRAGRPRCRGRRARDRLATAVNVFERFYRGDGTGRASGSGLGLAIARELAEAMQGEISLTSEPGRTVFTLSLPAASSTSSPPIE